MNKADVIKQIIETGVIPVVHHDEAMRAMTQSASGVSYSRSHDGAGRCRGDRATLESTVTLFGAGTVLDPGLLAYVCLRVRSLYEPALNVETIACCRRYGVAIMLYALTPTEVVQAWTAGADL